MKHSRKILGAALAITMVAASFAPIGTSKVDAAAFSAVAMYDFENGTGMNSSGISCTAPTVTNDSERGNVLKFASGTGSTTVTHDTDTTLEEHSWYINEGSPSSLKFPNPFKGKNLTGATISYWIKLPDEKSGGVVDGYVDETGGIANGIVGFVDSEFRYLQHPDCQYGGHSDCWWGSRSFFGINAQPYAYFAQIHHNCIVANDVDATVSYNPGKWQYVSVAITNDTIKMYVDGKPLTQTEVYKSKRFWGSDEYENPGNEGMPFLLDFLCDNMSYTFGGKAGTSTFIDKNSGLSVTYGKIPSNIQCYVGFTGFSPTYEGVCIDDLTFFTKAYSESDMAALYEAAKAGGISVDSSSSGSSATAANPSAVSQETAAALAASTKLIAAPEGVTIGTPIAILKGDANLGSTYDAVKAYLDTGVASIINATPEWAGLTMSKNIYIQEIPVTGRQLAAGETATIEMDVPSGFDTNMIWVLRIDPDGTVTKCNITSIANGKLQFETNSIAKFAVVQMTYGNTLPQTGVVDTAFFLIAGAAIISVGAVVLRKKEKLA